MINVHALDGASIGRIKPCYEAFAASAKTQYHWDIPPVDFDTFAQVISNGFLKGYWIEDTAEADPIGFLLYAQEQHRAIEINLFYVQEGLPTKVIVDRVMRRLIEDIAKLPGWDTVSFAMLGRQAELIRSLTWYGFKPVGQAILKFDLMDGVSVQILKQQQLKPLPEGYRLDCWQPEYAGGTAESILDAFSIATDALWDPRFRTLLGTRRVVGMVTAGDLGAHLKDCTTIALYQDTPVGFCFLVQATGLQGNIPLIGIRPQHQGKGLGSHMMQRTLDTVIDQILAGAVGMCEINATVDTDNSPALQTYRRMGFKEEANYPHVYLPRTAAEHPMHLSWSK